MFLSTTDGIEGRQVEALGLVEGSIVNTRSIGSDFGAVFKKITGGEITEYTGLLQEARIIARERMIQQAERLGANAVIGIRYATADVLEMACEIAVYGTAVRVI
jgi:uncharacterized protein YbjQ (UPF0145 family)